MPTVNGLARNEALDMQSLLNTAPGPRDHGRPAGGRAAVVGDSLQVGRGAPFRGAIMVLETSARKPARASPATVPQLNLLQRFEPGYLCHLRSGESGIMDRLRAREKNAGRSAEVSDKLRDERIWRRRCRSLRPAKPVRRYVAGCFVLASPLGEFEGARPVGGPRVRVYPVYRRVWGDRSKSNGRAWPIRKA